MLKVHTHLVAEALVHKVVEHVHVRPVLHVERFERDHALQPQVLALSKGAATDGNNDTRGGVRRKTRFVGEGVRPQQTFSPTLVRYTIQAGALRPKNTNRLFHVGGDGEHRKPSWVFSVRCSCTLSSWAFVRQTTTTTTAVNVACCAPALLSVSVSASPSLPLPLSLSVLSACLSHLQHAAFGRGVRLVQLLAEEVGDHGRALLLGLRVYRRELLAVDVSFDRQRKVLVVVDLFVSCRVVSFRAKPSI